MYLDSHTHLNSPQLYKDYKKYIENFVKIGGKKLVNVGVDYVRTERALKIESNFPSICLSTGGFHPTESIFKFKGDSRKLYEFDKEKIVSWQEYLVLAKEYLEQLAKNKKIIAIGECGIDYHYFDKEFLEKMGFKNIDENLITEIKKQQEDLFVMQLELAKKYNLPVVIHSRDAFYETCKIIENYKDLKLYFHCWGYGEKEVEYAQKTFSNLWIGYDGNITYKRAEDLRNSIKTTNLENILLETDAPYLTPQIIRKEQNQPANVSYIYDYVCSLLNIDLPTLQNQIKDNFEKFYNIKL